MKRIAQTFMGSSLTLLFLAVIFNFSQNASAAPATSVVISEIQIAGTTSNDDFIELYNPTSSDINLGDIRLVKRSSSGATDTDIVVFNASDTIKAHGYYLWCNSALNSTLTCDKTSSDTISNNNSIGLRSEPVNTGALIDSVTLGTPDNPLGEGTTIAAPDANTSVERKAKSSSTAISMSSGGVDELAGNSEDTNNNALDFIARSIPQAQNSLSSSEALTPTTPTSTLTPSVSHSPTPSSIPSPTQILSPSLSLSPTNFPSPTNLPTSIPTLTPIPTTIPSITPIPPTPTPKIIIQTPKISCSMMFKSIKIFTKTIYIPFVKCTRL